MIDQSNINLLELIPTELKKVGNTGGGEYHGACPFCGGTDRFIVQPNSGNGGHWWCRQCGRSGDAIKFLMDYDNLGFKAACEQMGAVLSDPPHKKPKTEPASLPVSDLRQDYACFEPDWQHAASQFIYACAGDLWDHWQTARAARYLESRGITLDMAKAEGLGMNTDDYRATWGSVEVWLPRGITIPWQIDKQFWNVRVRRPNADLKEGADKYISPKGVANGLYAVASLRLGVTAVMTEGEFDAILLQHFLLRRGVDNVAVVSIGSCTGARVMRWVTRLMLADRILLVFDADLAGESAANWWYGALYPKAKRLKPSRKDITEMWQCGELVRFAGELA